MQNYKQGQWLIGNKAASDHWQPINAKTLIGAKKIATIAHPEKSLAIGTPLEVAKVFDMGQVVVMSKKYVYNKWTDQ